MSFLLHWTHGIFHWICGNVILLCVYFRACYGVLRFVMESGAKGCEVCSPNAFMRYYNCGVLLCLMVCLFDLSRSLWVVNWEPRGQNPWSLRMATWFLLGNLSRITLTLQWDTCSSDRLFYFNLLIDCW